MYNKPITAESTTLTHHDKAPQDRDCFINGRVQVELGIRYKLLLHNCCQVLRQRGVLLLQAQLLHLDDLVQLFQLLILPADAAKWLQWNPFAWCPWSFSCPCSLGATALFNRKMPIHHRQKCHSYTGILLKHAWGQ